MFEKYVYKNFRQEQVSKGILYHYNAPKFSKLFKIKDRLVYTHENQNKYFCKIPNNLQFKQFNTQFKMQFQIELVSTYFYENNLYFCMKNNENNKTLLMRLGEDTRQLFEFDVFCGIFPNCYIHPNILKNNNQKTEVPIIITSDKKTQNNIHEYKIRQLDQILVNPTDYIPIDLSLQKIVKFKNFDGYGIQTLVEVQDFDKMSIIQNIVRTHYKILDEHQKSSKPLNTICDLNGKILEIEEEVKGTKYLSL